MTEAQLTARTPSSPSPDDSAPPQDMILGRDIEIGSLPEANETPLSEFHQAAYNGQLDKMRKIIRKEEIKNIDERDSIGRTALHWGTAAGNVELVVFLMDRKAKINATDRLGWTPLTMAALYGHDTIVRFLLSRGADPFTVDTQKATALHYACSQGNDLAAQALLTRGARVDAEDTNKATPLHYSGMY